MLRGGDFPQLLEAQAIDLWVFALAQAEAGFERFAEVAAAA